MRWVRLSWPSAGLALLTPSDVHHGRVAERVAARNFVLAAAYAAHPERFPHGKPTAAVAPTEVWINKPNTQAAYSPQTPSGFAPAARPSALASTDLEVINAGA